MPYFEREDNIMELALKKEVKIGGKKVMLGASAMLPLDYRAEFGREIFNDIKHVSQTNLCTLHDITYSMAKHAWEYSEHNESEQFPSEREWLCQFGIMDIFNSIDEILTLWGYNAAHSSETKKK